MVAPGQLPASPSPSAKRKPQKLRRPSAIDVAMAATEYQSDGEAQAVARAEAVDEAAGEGLAHRIGDAEGDQDPGEVGVRPLVLGLQVGGEDAQRLAVDVVDDGGEEEEPPDVPAQVPDRTRQWSSPFGSGARTPRHAEHRRPTVDRQARLQSRAQEERDVEGGRGGRPRPPRRRRRCGRPCPPTSSCSTARC